MKTRIPPKTARDIMRADVVTVRAHWDIREALRIFQQKGISGAPVLDGEGKLTGVLSVADIARGQEGAERRALAHCEYYGAPILERDPDLETVQFPRVAVRDVMTPLVIDAPEEATVADLAGIMVERHVHRVIITREGEVVGIVSTLDLLRTLARRRAG
jgi:CBS domain-containing protein